MNTLNIKQAATLAGVSRSTLYRSYIQTGRLSVTDDDYGKPAIDVSELLRVFPHMKTDVPQNNDTQHVVNTHRIHTKSSPLAAELEKTKELLRVREEQLREASTREEKLLELMASLQRQLTQDKKSEPARAWWKIW
jgi:DNA-binding transcriptional MerR regulator